MAKYHICHSQKLQMTWTNYHSHCSYCDGTSSLERYIEQAVEAGMHSYGVSCHGPMPLDIPWAMKKSALSDYLSEFLRLRAKWQNQIELYVGLEIDFVPGNSWWDQIGPLYRDLDYVIGSVHLVDAFDDGRPWEVDGSRDKFVEGLDQIFGGDVRAAVSRYYELTRWMVMLENPEVVGHLDKIKLHNINGRYFDETESWYRQEIDKTLKVISNMGSIVEVNTRGLYTGRSLDLFPSHWVLERIHSLGIPITLSSDAHAPKEVKAGFEFAAKMLHRIGFRKMSIMSGGKWRRVSFDADGLDLHWHGKAGNRTA